MALLLIQPGMEPAGQFNLKEEVEVLGGEVGVFESTGTDEDGYQIGIQVRPALPTDTGPFCLLDDGLNGYGVYFGAELGRTVTGFADGYDTAERLGPSTYVASGKVTIWHKPGLYAITLDALVDDEVTLRTATPGSLFTIDGYGKLVLGGSQDFPVAYLVEFVSGGTLASGGGVTVNQKRVIISFNPFGKVEELV